MTEDTFSDTSFVHWRDRDDAFVRTAPIWSIGTQSGAKVDIKLLQMCLVVIDAKRQKLLIGSVGLFDLFQLTHHPTSCNTSGIT